MLTRKNIMDAALAVFSRKGYALSTLEDIAAEARVTRGAIYWHFEDKKDIYASLVQERSSQVFSLFEEILNENISPAQKLRNLLLQPLLYIEKNPEYRSIMELTTFKTEVTEEMRPFVDQKVETNRRLLQEFSKIIAEGQVAGEIRQEINPADAGITLMGFLNGILLLWITDTNAFSPEESGEAIVDTFLRGFLAE